MKYSEKKISLVGWGEWQVMLHTIKSDNACLTGLTVVENNRITRFGLTPWLKGLITVVPTTARYCHAAQPLGACAELILQMRRGRDGSSGAGHHGSKRVASGRGRGHDLHGPAADGRGGSAASRRDRKTVLW
jgi:hypothetical protein